MSMYVGDIFASISLYPDKSGEICSLTAEVGYNPVVGTKALSLLRFLGRGVPWYAGIRRLCMGR